MIPQSRDDIRQVYLEVWQKMQTSAMLQPLEAMIAEIIETHPEYHTLLTSGDAAKEKDFTPEGTVTNPFLHMGMHIALREQANSDHPAGIAAIHQQLCNKLGQHAAEHAMMECLGQSLWRAQRTQQAPDENQYLACLNQL